MPSLNEFDQKTAAAGAEERPAHDYDLEAYAKARLVPKGWIELTNPTSRTITAIVHLGPPPGSKAPRFDLDEDDELSQKQRAALDAYLASLATRLTFAPGEVKQIPRDMVPALVLVRDGQVVGGLLPQLRIPNDPNPPRSMESVLGEDEIELFAVPKKGAGK